MPGWQGIYLHDDEDRLWFDEGLRWGWVLPEPAAPFLRIWGIRHFRAFHVLWKAYFEFDGAWRPYWHQEWVAYAIRRGWC